MSYVTHNEETLYMLEQLKAVLGTYSPTGYTRHAAELVYRAFEALGFAPQYTNKGGVLVCLSEGEESQRGNGILLEAHLDTLGAMVAQVKDNGRLRVTPLGGMNANNAETENVYVVTRSGKMFEGTLQMKNASVHVNGEYNKTERNWDNVEVLLDEEVRTKDETEKLGVMTGDIVCFDPRTRVTESGYIKSRFLDDKLSVSILLGYARHLSQGAKTKRPVYCHITVFEEVGHGGAASFPANVSEVLSVDMGCVGEGLACRETQVSICAKDSGGPYHYDVVSNLIEAAKREQVDFAVDVYPFYGSDAEAGLRAGHDVRHGLIGAGVYASHGYERSHVKGMENTLKLLKAYLG